MITINKSARPIIIFAPSVLAGAEKVVITGTNSLFEMGLNPIIIVIQETRIPHLAIEFIKYLNPEMEIKIFTSKTAIDFKLVLKIRDYINSLNFPAIVHTHGFKGLVLTKLAGTNILHVHTHHGNTSHTFKVKCYEWLANLAMKRTDQVIAVSEEMEKQLREELSPYQSITTIKNMVSIKDADIIRNKRKELLSSTVPLELIYVGRISPEKGLIAFIKNFSTYKNKDHFKFTILGDGPDRTMAEELILTNQLRSHFKFVGFVNNISDYFITADALILPSFTEGLPMTILESLAFGVPVIANDVGAIKSLIKNNENGLVINSNDSILWHEALEATLCNIRKWQEVATNRAPMIVEDYSVNNWTIKTVQLYNRII